MAPTSYQPPTRGDTAKTTTYSQSAESALRITETPVSEILAAKSNEVLTIGPDDLILDAVKILREKRIGALVVTDSANNMLGILSERDIVRKMADIPGRTLEQKVSTLMTEKVITCEPDDKVVEVLKNMTENRFRHVPVLINGQLGGMITIGDVVDHEATLL